MLFSWLFLLFGVVPLLATGKGIVPTTEYVTCKDIKTSDGFTFDLKPNNNQDPVDSVEITQNGETIYNGKFELLNCSSKGCHVKAITTAKCDNISVTFIHNIKGGKISESRLDINVIKISEPETNETNAMDKSSTDSNWPIIIACTVIGVFVVVVVVFALWARCTKKGRAFVDKFKIPCVNKQTGTSNVAENRSDEENRTNAEKEKLLHKRGENGMSNGGTDVSINMEACTTDKNSDDKSAPRVKGLHKDLNGNMGHDPGGGKEDATLHCNGDLSHHEESTGEQRINGDKEDGGCSAFNQRSTREEPFDKTAGSEVGAPVHGVCPGRASISPPDNVDNEANHKAAATMFNNNNNNNNNNNI